MEVYFDNAATTKVLDSVKDLVVKVMTEDYGNAAAMHLKGVQAENYIKAARAEIAKTMKVQEKEIVFTSGGTESNNTALIGGALGNPRAGKHVISSAIEHASVYNPLGVLEELGYEITYLPVDGKGHISLQELSEAVRPDTVLVSIMYVNNEVGSVEPVEELSRVIKKKNPNTLFHVDAIQAYGKYTIRPRRQGIDLLSASGHKFHGPKGVGFLYIGENVNVKPLIYGGGQQKGMRSGTENVPGVAGLGLAAREMYTNHEDKVNLLYGLKEYMMDCIGNVPGTHINSEKGRDSAPHVVSIGFEGIRSEVLLHALEERGIYVSSGSACSSSHPGISDTLKGIGVRKDLLDAALRFSFSIFNTKEEIDYAIGALQELLPVLRRYQRG